MIGFFIYETIEVVAGMFTPNISDDIFCRFDVDPYALTGYLRSGQNISDMQKIMLYFIFVVVIKF